MHFTGHNILLNNGQATISAQQTLLANSAMWKSIEKTINLFIPQNKEERAKMRVVDLGCLEGGYTVEFAKMGFNALGIEAREDNIAKCNYVKANLSLPSLNFAQDDVRNVGKYGEFDITLCYGLLYHLNDPAAFLKQLSGCTSKILLVHTHFSPEWDARYKLGPLNKYFIAPIQKRTKVLEHQKNYRLSPIVEHEGYKGRWFKEWNAGASKAKIEKMLWASYNNDRSFWPCKKDLTKALHDVGFNSVFEQFDFVDDTMRADYTEYYSRTMFVAVKH